MYLISKQKLHVNTQKHKHFFRKIYFSAKKTFLSVIFQGKFVNDFEAEFSQIEAKHVINSPRKEDNL